MLTKLVHNTTDTPGNAYSANNTNTGLAQTSGMIDTAATSAKDPNYTNTDRNTPGNNQLI